MTEASQEFRSSIKTILIIGIAIFAVLYLQVAENANKSSVSQLAHAKRSGSLMREAEATQLGLGRYDADGSNFVWNAEVFEKMGIAMDSLIRSEKRASEVAQVSLSMAELSLSTWTRLNKVKGGGEDGNK